MSAYETFDPKEISFQRMHALLQSAVVPRPISFASTIDMSGQVNLSPFSFFNVFSSNPPILIFSPSRRGRDNTTKHTLENVKEVSEVVINIVNYSMVEQASLASVEFPKGVNEFLKAGFTPVPSIRVKPPRVLESPVSFECKVQQIVELGIHGGAGNLVICEVLLMHVSHDVLDANGHIDPFLLDAVARMGQDYYSRAKDGAFIVPKPNDKPSIGYDQIPARVRNNAAFTKNELGRLGSIERFPGTDDLRDFRLRPEVQRALQEGSSGLIDLAKQLLKEGKTEDAFKALLLE